MEKNFKRHNPKCPNCLAELSPAHRHGLYFRCEVCRITYPDYVVLAEHPRYSKFYDKKEAA